MTGREAAEVVLAALLAFTMIIAGITGALLAAWLSITLGGLP